MSLAPVGKYKAPGAVPVLRAAQVHPTAMAVGAAQAATRLPWESAAPKPVSGKSPNITSLGNLGAITSRAPVAVPTANPIARRVAGP